jgi:hypothetical protein
LFNLIPDLAKAPDEHYCKICTEEITLLNAAKRRILDPVFEEQKKIHLNQVS